MKPITKSRILIADHDQTFLDQLADRLLQMDMEVDFAENGKTAMDLVESETYDLIIVEIAMPLYNGLEILRKAKLKEAKPQSNLLEHPSELKLIKLLIRFPEVIEDTAKDYQVQRLPQYAMDLATAFHQFIVTVG